MYGGVIRAHVCIEARKHLPLSLPTLFVWDKVCPWTLSKAKCQQAPPVSCLHPHPNVGVVCEPSHTHFSKRFWRWNSVPHTSAVSKFSYPLSYLPNLWIFFVLLIQLHANGTSVTRSFAKYVLNIHFNIQYQKNNETKTELLLLCGVLGEMWFLGSQFPTTMCAFCRASLPWSNEVLWNFKP